MTGTATFLKEKNRNVKAVAIQAQQNHLLQGLRNFEESDMPDLFKRRESVVDQWFTATNKESFDSVKDLLVKEGLFVGPSSGSVLSCMLKVSKSIEQGVLSVFLQMTGESSEVYTNNKKSSQVTNIYQQ